MDYKFLQLYTSSSGKKIKTSGLSLNQNSNNNVIQFITEGNYDMIEVWFRQPNSRISPKYHMVLNGQYESDSVDPLLASYGKMNEWRFQIPLAETSFTMPNPTAKLEVSFACYKYDNYNRLLVAATANTQIVVNRSNNNDVLDQSYNGEDVQNLWKYVGELKNKIDLMGGSAIPDMPENNGTYTLKCTVVNGVATYKWEA